MKNKTSTKRTIITVIVVLLTINIMGCSKSNLATNEMASMDTFTSSYSEETLTESAKMKDDNQEASYSGDEGSSQDIMSNQKIIQTKYITMETTDFDNVTVNAENLIDEYLGYIESSQVIGRSINNYTKYNTRNANYTFRVPAKDFENFLNDLKALGNVINERMGTENVTTQYYDFNARINTLKVEEQRLLEIVEEGAELSQVLEVENHLADVRYQIETYTAKLKNLENKVDYGTVYLELREVIKESVEPKPAVTFSEKISNGFSESIKDIKDFFVNLIVSIISASPYLVIWGIVIFLVILIIKSVNRRNRKKHNKIIEQTQEKKE